MIKAARWMGVLLGLVLVVPVGADDAYTLKLYELAKGDTILIERVDVDEVHLVTRDAEGKQVDEKRQKQATTLVFWEQVLEKPAGAARPTKMRRGFGTASIQAGGEEQKIGLAGKVVLIELQEGRYRFFVDNKELMGAETDFLDKEFNRAGSQRPFRYDMILPGKPVKLNEAWDVDAATWIESLRAATGLGFVADKISSSGQLLKTSLKDDKRYGTLAFRLEAPLKTYRKAGQDLPVLEGGRLALQVTLDVAIDGSEPFGTLKLAGQTSFEVAADADGQKYTTSVTARNRREQTVKPYVKK